MGRFILLVVALFILIWLVRSTLAGRKRGRPDSAAPPHSELVSCAHCGVHLPRAEARSAGGHHFCSEEHWRLGPRDE
jgi:uncharacterized protein